MTPAKAFFIELVAGIIGFIIGVILTLAGFATLALVGVEVQNTEQLSNLMGATILLVGTGSGINLVHFARRRFINPPRS